MQSRIVDSPTSRAPLQPEPVEDDIRLAARLCNDDLLRVLRLVADAHEGELLTAIVAQGVIGADD